MSYLQIAYHQGVEDAYEKFAARRGVKEIRKAFGQGDFGRASQLAKTPGVLGPGAAEYGTQLKDLSIGKDIKGKPRFGGEALPTVVATPQEGLTVRKLDDPNADLFSKEIGARRAAHPNVPGSSQVYRTGRTPMGTPMRFEEYVQGKPVTSEMLRDPGTHKQYMASLLASRRYGRNNNLDFRDMRTDNAIRTPEGKIKFIDNMPFRPGEAKPLNDPKARAERKKHPERLQTTDEGDKLFDVSRAEYGMPRRVTHQDPGPFKKYLFTGQAPQPITRVRSKPQVAPPMPVPPGAEPLPVPAVDPNKTSR